jgi:hypothetical protein
MNGADRGSGAEPRGAGKRGLLSGLHRPMISSEGTRAARGAMILVVWLLTPLAFGMMAPLTSPGFVTLLVWQWSVFPHAIAYVGPGHAQLAWSPATARLIAVLQWLFVGAAFGWLTRNRGWPTQAGLAPLAIIVTSVVLHTILRLCGYVVFQGLP